MFPLIVSTTELKCRYEHDEFAPLNKYYTFLEMVDIVLSAQHVDQQYLLLQEKFQFTDFDQADFENANVVSVMALLFEDALRMTIIAVLNHRFYYGLVRHVHDGIIVGVSETPEPGYVFDSAAPRPFESHDHILTEFTAGVPEFSGIDLGLGQLGSALGPALDTPQDLVYPHGFPEPAPVATTFPPEGSFAHRHF